MIGAYRLTEQVGKGGFSEVWSAWDTRLNRLVAVKLIPSSTDDAQHVIQFKREALIVSQLDHPNILPLYDFGEEGTWRYLVMRYVTGGSLASLLKTKTLTPKEILRLMTPIASTLDYLHEQRVVHRDFKPPNILLDARGTPYLTDFGMAKQLTDETRQLHSVSGTLTYMAPEQFNGGNVSRKSDLYSFGITLYQLFSGGLPFGGEYVFALRQANRGDELPDVTEANPSLPLQLNEFLWQLTALDPDKRPDSALETITKIADLFQVDSGAATFSDIDVALESNAYRQQEAKSLLDKNLPEWRKGNFFMSRTHFTLLNIILGGLPELVTSEVRSLMLRAALDDGQAVDTWWNQANDEERKLACWNAIKSINVEVCLRALQRISGTPWAAETSAEIINQLGWLLAPNSPSAPAVLQFLEQALPKPKQWGVDTRLPDIDRGLGALAAKGDVQAARLIGKARRTQAIADWPKDFSRFRPLLIIYEAAGTLPDQQILRKVVLTITLGLRQLTQKPLRALQHYFRYALGNMLAVGLMVFVVYRGLTLTDTSRILNSLGQGIMFGLIYGFGVWLASHISQRLHVAHRVTRILIGALLGGFIVAMGFMVFQSLVYDDVIDFAAAFPAGLLYVLGVAISAEMSAFAQILLGAAGIIGAFLVPWITYLSSIQLDPDSTTRAVFFFDDSVPESAVPLVVVAALIIVIVGVQRHRRKIPPPVTKAQ